MHTCLEEHQPRVIALCTKYQAERLYAFGSAVGGGFDVDKSDFDFLVRFFPCTPEEHADRYFGLLESLEALLETKVDLVEIDAIKNPYFRQEVEATRILLYAA
ncbi:MAG: nucleotidyltransferase domain-containing protein [Candidatus Hydrogenedentes bacterium]|nr:nucleotidyltransferase domain-containing protein [Candidatus Hydrogenedentota bacterium]MBI3118517.1 nucleotidyltransferase domain-containing protein [Candidatus Hydrogenedentota bacterium]